LNLSAYALTLNAHACVILWRTVDPQFRVRFKSFLMQQLWPKTPANEATDSKEQMFQAGSDFFEKIGNAPSPHDSRNLMLGWTSACAAYFPGAGRQCTV
jgi:hypothetical protein